MSRTAYSVQYDIEAKAASRAYTEQHNEGKKELHAFIKSRSPDAEGKFWMKPAKR